MKCLLLYCNFFRYTCVKKLNFGEDITQYSKDFKYIHVCFISVEKNDTEKDIAYITDSILNLKENLICVYPYIHLTSTPKNETISKLFLDIIINTLKTKKIVIAVPFGWKKSFNIILSENLDSELFFDSINAIEEKSMAINSQIKVITENGFTNNFPIYYNLVLGEKKESIFFKQNFAETLESTDIGSYMLNPLGTKIYYNIQQYIRNLIENINYITEIKTPIIINFKNKNMKTYVKKFPTRLYFLKENLLGLRFAACPHMFTFFSKKFIDYKHLPMGLFEFAECFRLEQNGEVNALDRHKQFTMPDLHVLIPNEKMQVITKFIDYLKLTLKFVKDFDLKKIVPTLRTSIQIYEKEKDFITQILKTIQIPCILEVWDQVYYYFDMKYELNYITQNNKILQLSTVQIDSLNAINFDIKYNSSVNNERWSLNFENKPIILHISLTGSIERVLRVVNEKDNLLFIKPIKLLIINIDKDRNLSFLDLCKFEIYTIIQSKLKLNSFIKKIKTEKFKTIAAYIIIGNTEEISEKIEINFVDKKEILFKKQVANYLNSIYDVITINKYKKFNF